jgi:translation initiation factor 2-alpha kinase 4
MELCDSTFRDYLNNINQNKSIEKRIFYFIQIIEGIKYLHNNDIIHRDIKPSNILFIDETIKICDFGLARNVNSTSKIINGSSEVGTSFYRAPEIDSHNYNNKIDVYSLGIILIELLLIKCKTQAEKMMYIKEILENIKENKIEYIPYLITNRYDEIILNMINKNVEERYDIYDVKLKSS